MPKIVKVPQLAWHNPRELALTFPDSWDVEVLNMAGYNTPAMTTEQIKASITNLIGSPPIRELAKGKKEVVITFDDITRVTRIAQMVPFVLDELATAGVSDNQIRFIAAIGTHGPMTRIEFVKKLGEDVVARFPVFNHNPYENCTYVGTTSRGNKVHINTEYTRCDFKIAIGSCTPHGFAVYSGGGKNILPGVSSIDTIYYNHTMELTDQTKFDWDKNPRRHDMEETAKLAGVDVLIESIFNSWGDPVVIFAGNETLAHEQAANYARGHYRTKKAENKDIVISNTYAKAMEAATGLSKAVSVRNGGDMVLISNAPEGQVNHYLCGPWGKTTAGRLMFEFQTPPHLNHLIMYTEYPDRAGLQWFRASAKILALQKWADVIKTLKECHGDKASVTVYPNADVQQFG